MRKFFGSLIVKLIIGVAVGIFIGFIASANMIGVINTVKFILGQVISFMVPLIIVGFITPAITQLRANASKMLGTMLVLAYTSTVCACLMSMMTGYAIIPGLNIVTNPERLISIPALVFKLEIPALFSVMSALVLSLLLGMAVLWTKAELIEKVLLEFNKIVLSLVEKVVIPILPVFIACTFAILAYEGSITQQAPVFLKIIVIVMILHYIWLAVLYTIAGIISHKSPWEILKYYGPAYLTAVGTMSSAATLSVALDCAKKSKVLSDEVRDFAIPLGATVHLCGSALTETFFVMAISKVLYGFIPNFATMFLFVILLGIFAVGAPGVPGGTVMASLGIIISVLGFNDTGVALMLTVFALQDSFGTACNVTADGALALMLEGLFGNKNV